MAGLWLIRRVIRPHARFAGEASVEKLSADEYLWRETGQLALAAGGNIEAHRLFKYRLDRQQQSIAVYYADGPQSGDLLHVFTSGPSANHVMRHTHICGPDTYRAILRLENIDAFRLSYLVTGPSKRYSIASALKRVVRS